MNKHSERLMQIIEELASLNLARHVDDIHNNCLYSAHRDVRDADILIKEALEIVSGEGWES